MIAEVCDALRSAGAEDDNARKAADAIAESETELKTIEGGLGSEMHGFRLEMRSVRGDIATMNRMNGGLLAVARAIAGRLLFA